MAGILNGVDYEEWNAATDPYLKSPYSPAQLAGKNINKEELQKEMGLAATPAPLFGTITRLAEQKGIDIQLAALEEMLSAEMQFVLLGAGSPAYEHGYHELARRFPKKVAVRFGYNEGLSHRIEAGCDFYLMPSRYEPSGLNQMYSLRYGTIPIVRATGGLDDSVIDYGQNPEAANGVKFYEYTSRALSKAIRKALAIYQEPELFREFRRNAMKALADTSAPGDDQAYREAFEKMLATVRILHDRGVFIVFGTATGGSFTYHREMELYQKAGFTAPEILKRATYDSAKYTGQDQRMGSIEKGKLADFFLIPGDPTKDLKAVKTIRMVVKDGTIYYPTEVYPKFGIQPFTTAPPVTTGS